MIVPTGSPAWSRTTTLSDYGGDSTKTDYLGVGSLNSKTDVSTANFLRMCADLLAVVRTAPLCEITYTSRDSTSQDPLVTMVSGMWGTYVGAGYNGGTPPTGFPTVTLSTTGLHLINLASSYTDDYGVAQAVSINAATASVAGTLTGVVAVPLVSTATFEVDVYVYTASTGAAVADKTITVAIY